MKRYIESLVEFSGKSLGHIIFIGAGTGGDVAELTTLNPKAITSVESSGKLFTALARKLKKYKFVTLKNEWVFPADKTEGVVRLYNNPRFNSLKIGKDLVRGSVALESEEKVQGISLQSLLSGSSLKDDTLNFLVLNIGFPEYLLSGLSNNDDLFKNIDFIIFSQAVSLEGAEINSSSIFDYFYYLPTFDDSGYSIYQKNDNLVNLKKRLAPLQREVSNSKHLMLEVENLRAEIKRVAEKNVKSEAALIQKNDENSKAKLKINDLKAIVSEKEKALQLATKSLEELKDEKKQQVLSLSEQLNKANDSERHSIEHSSLTSKLNLKLRSDLANLRKKYAEKVKAEAELTTLISELYVILKQASQFYNTVNEKYPDIAVELDE